jgi:hypothetical protein
MLRKALLILFSTFSVLTADLPEPYASIEVLPFDNHGWFANAEPLEILLTAVKPKTVIEVGSWLGSSTRFIASLLDEDAKLYAIDTWLGSDNESEHQKDPRLPTLYQQFLSNVIHQQMTDVIIPVRMKSMEAARALKVKADFIYIDGAHDTWSVMNDILYWHLHLNEGGIICGDDWGWASVQVAVIQCANVLNKKIHATGNFWWYE